jgi:hypothetical protein
MEETVGPVSTCGRELLRGWWRPIGLMMSFMIFTASVRNILDTPSYCGNTGISGLLDKLQAIIRKYEVQAVHTVGSHIAYKLYYFL